MSLAAYCLVLQNLRLVLGMQPTENLLDDKIREITFEGPLILIEKDRSIDTHVFLFTDFLLFTKLKKDVKRSRGVGITNVAT